MDVQFDETRLKALLRLPRFPPRFLQQEPWQSWIRTHGDLQGIYAYLRTCPLASAQKELLELLLTHQYSHVQDYADALGISVPTYFSRLRQLVPDLLTHLNHWESASLASPRPAPWHAGLPAPLTSFIGAGSLIKKVCGMLRNPAIRLVTLTGPGGVGKTRLGLQAATQIQAEFPDGVCYVSLEHLKSPEEVAQRLAQALGIKENNNQPIHDLLLYRLRDTETLLLFDNFEQVSAAASLVTTLLMSAYKVKALVTSQSPLRVYGEHECRVSPLAFPDPTHKIPCTRLMRFDAVRLFVERARAVQTDFELTDGNAAAISGICAELDGLPLAIELAAARMQMYSPEQILSLLIKDRFEVLTNGPLDVPARHRTLRATLDWTYQLLDDAERCLFRRLAIFENGFALEAAAAIDAATQSVSGSGTQSVIDRLLQKSLLHTDTTRKGARFFMLQTVRKYALECLNNGGEWEETSRAHADYFSCWVETSHARLDYLQEAAWIHCLNFENDNLRVAFRWLIDQNNVEQALRLAETLLRYWKFPVHQQEIAWSGLLLEKSHGLASPTRIDVLIRMGWIYYERMTLEYAAKFFDEALTLARRSKDTNRVSAALHGTGEIAQARGDHSTALAMYQESLALSQALADPVGIGWSMSHIANMASINLEIDYAITLLEECLVIFQHSGDAQGILVTKLNLGRMLLERSEFSRATALFDEALELTFKMEKQSEKSRALFSLGLTAFKQKRIETAKQLFRNGLEAATEQGILRGLLDFIEGLMSVSIEQGERQRAAVLAGALHHQRQVMNLPIHPIDQPGHEYLLARLRQNIEESSFIKRFQEGMTYSLEQLIQVALHSI
ncbi:MAG: ATP-binding protein [Chloroflexota bacterium]